MEALGKGMTDIEPEFWAGKRVMLTGHTGFKGSWLSIWLASMKAEVYGFALQPATSPSLYREALVADNLTSVIGDVRDLCAVQSAVESFKPEIIIHMAAQPLVRESYQYPVDTYATNVMGTVHLLEAAKNVDSVQVILNITSDKCYENKEWLWGYREDEPMGGYDPYSSSKGCSELVTSAYRRSFYEERGIAVASARAGNVIGGGDWSADRLIPDIFRAIDKNQPVIIRNPYAIRPWQHVIEPLSGYLILIQKLYVQRQEFSQGWNFGPNDNDVYTVEWIANYIIKSWGDGVSWKLDENSHPHEANYLKLDISKSKLKLDWHPVWSLSTALEMVIDWHKCWKSGSDIKQKCMEQISHYQESCGMMN